MKTYDTKISDVEKDLDINLGQKNPNMKLGEFLAQNGYKPLADILKPSR
jgi:hypothetical protein